MLWVPVLLKPQAERAIGEAFGRKATIGAVEFRPWSLELTLRDLAVRTQDGSGDQLNIGQIYANAALASVWRWGLVLDALQVDQPRLKLRQLEPGRYDIDDIVARLAAPSDTPPGDPPRFALYNLTLADGAIDFRDEVVDRTHEVRGLHLGLPFLSSLPAYREVETVPRLAFRLNGSVFDSSASSTPFLASRRTAARLTVDGLDVAPYLGYLPKGLPLQLRSGTLQADLEVEFEQTPDASVLVKGRLGLGGLQLLDVRGGELLQVEQVAVDIAELRPLQRVVKLAALEVQGPHLLVERDAQGRLRLLPDAGGTPSPVPSPASTPEATPSQPWSFALVKASLQDGHIRWRDQAITPAAELSLEQLSLSLEDVAYPFAEPARLKGSAQLQGAGGPPAVLAFEGAATDKAADVRATLQGVRLDWASGYLQAALKPRVQGELAAALALAWQADGALMVTSERLTLAQLAVASAEPMDIRALELRDARVDLAGRTVDIGTVHVARPRLAIARNAQGRWMFEDWLVPPQAAAPSTPAGPPWRVALRSIELDDGSVSYADQAVPRPVALSVSALRMRAGPLRSDQLKQAMPLELSAAVSAGKSAPGRATLRGQLALEPVALQAELDLQKLPLHALEPYFGDALNLQLARADTSFKGSLRYAAQAAGPSVQLEGDLGVEDLRAQQRTATGASANAPGRDLLSWTTLRLRGLSVEMAPGAALAMGVAETALSDFYARVVVDETGRINLQDLVKPTPAADGAPTADAGPPPRIRFGPIQVQNGRVLFSDRFVKPNYTANLTELRGRLSAFDSAGAAGAQPAMADLTLRGRAEGTASLEIDGKLNPLAKPLALDIRAKARDLELPPLSPYSVKYAGHGIERGKLSVDLHYQVLPNGQLTASNSLVLNQLTFGDPVPGAPASLPVRLATALLADRHGVIDLNLPIQGSLNDPQFSLGPVIMKAIGNLILKAVTAPFSLLASAFGGGGEELGQVTFAAGSAALDREAEQQLDKVARALADRPGLKLSVVGTASQEAERDGFKRARLQRMVQGEKRRGSLAAGEPLPARGASQPQAEVGADEYPALLKAVYERAELADKPRNALGLAKELQVPEMEALLLADMQISDDAIRNLAVQRSVAVRDYLAAQQIPLERLFLGAPKTVASEGGWKPRAELELATP